MQWQIFSEMFNDYANLRPWKKAAHLLAQEIWGPLYDLEKLARNGVPVSAVTWVFSRFQLKIELCASVVLDILMTCSSFGSPFKKMFIGWPLLVWFPPFSRYVDFGFAQDTASKIKGTEQYITNQLFHDGIRDDAKDVMKRLFQISQREYCWSDFFFFFFWNHTSPFVIWDHQNATFCSL